MAKTQAVELKKLNTKTLEITLIGDSPLIHHRWSDKVKKEMLDKQMKKPVSRRAKNPEEQYEESKYSFSDGKPGFPADAFKQSAVRGGKSLGVVMTDAKTAFFVLGVYSEKDGRDLVPIKGEFQMREDMVKLQTGVADIRYRAQVPSWEAVLTIQYNASVLSADQIVNMFNSAGFGVGVGEWRPQRNGMFGRFHVKGI